MSHIITIFYKETHVEHQFVLGSIKLFPVVREIEHRRDVEVRQGAEELFNSPAFRSFLMTQYPGLSGLHLQRNHEYWKNRIVDALSKFQPFTYK